MSGNAMEQGACEELHGAFAGDCDLELKGSAVSCTSSSWSQPTFHYLRVWYYAGFKGVAFDRFLELLYCYSSTSHSFVSFLVNCLCFHAFEHVSFKKQFVSSNPRIALLSQRVLFLQEGLSLRTRAAAILSGCLNWGA